MIFNINSGSSPRYNYVFTGRGHSLQSDSGENETLIVNQRRLYDSADHSADEPSQLQVRPNGTNYRLSSVKRHPLHLLNPVLKLTCMFKTHYG